MVCGLPKISFNARVSNGRKSYAGQFPWLAGLFIDSVRFYCFPRIFIISKLQKFKCGATLISSKTVITASHCITSSNDEVLDANRFKIMLGMQHRKILSGNERLMKVCFVIINILILL